MNPVVLPPGRAANTPVVLVENCGRPGQRVLRMRLGELERRQLQWQGPVLMMIGAALATRVTALGDDECIASKAA